MKTLLFLLLSISVSAQLTNTPKVIYKASKTDTISLGFTPVGASAVLSVKADNEVIDDHVTIVGYRVLQLVLDSGATVVASAIGGVGYTVYRNGVNVTPAPVADNSLAEYLNWFNGLTAAQQRRVIIYGLWKQGFSIKDLKKSQ